MNLNIKNKWVKNIIITCLVVLFIAGGLFIGFVIHETRKIGELSDRSYQEREANFKITPNVTDAFVLTRKSWKRQEYKKTIFYAEYCEKAGIDKTNLGWLVHTLKASAYSKYGNLEWACSEANLAESLVQRDRIPSNNVKEYGLNEILDKCSK